MRDGRLLLWRWRQHSCTVMHSYPVRQGYFPGNVGTCVCPLLVCGAYRQSSVRGEGLFIYVIIIRGLEGCYAQKGQGQGQSDRDERRAKTSKHSTVARQRRQRMRRCGGSIGVAAPHDTGLTDGRQSEAALFRAPRAGVPRLRARCLASPAAPANCPMGGREPWEGATGAHR